MTKVSVIMSIHNNDKFLRKAVQSMLRQTFTDFEFIIIDDASTDSSLMIIRKFVKKDKRIKIKTNKKRIGLTKSLNKALRQARGDYIARMDGDDICSPERLEKQIKFLENNRDIAFCGTAVILIDENNKELSKKTHPLADKDVRKVALRYCPFIHPTLLFRREILDKVGMYDEQFNYSQDYELVLRLLSKYKAANLAEPLLWYRVGGERSISVENLKQQELLALKARWLALTKYGFSKWEIYKLIKPALSYLIPANIKIRIYKKFFWE